MATLVSVNVGLPKNVAWNGRTVYTGVWKQPVPGPQMVHRLNVDGDGQGDLGGHGGENRAVLVGYVDEPEADTRAVAYALGAAAPMGRLVKPDEIAKTLAFLASEDSGFTTGHYFPLDGGLTLD